MADLKTKKLNFSKGSFEVCAAAAATAAAAAAVGGCLRLLWLLQQLQLL